MALDPVFGLSVSGGFAVAPPPFVLPFPGVPLLSGSVGFSASVGGVVSGGIGGSIGISGGAGGSIGIGADGAIGIGLGGSFGLSGGVSAGVSVGPFSASLNLSLGPLMTEDKPGSIFAGPPWGIFDASGNPVATWDSVIKVDYRHEMRVADFPIEQGGFASYNKVQVPYDARISFAVGAQGGTAGRTQLLTDLETAVASLDFYTVVTPEATYYQGNLIHLDYTRETRRGVTLLVVDVWVAEVRPTATADTVAEPQSPTSEPAKNTGQSQAKPAPTTAAPATGASGPTESGSAGDQPASPESGGDPEGGLAAMHPGAAAMPARDTSEQEQQNVPSRMPLGTAPADPAVDPAQASSGLSPGGAPPSWWPMN